MQNVIGATLHRDKNAVSFILDISLATSSCSRHIFILLCKSYPLSLEIGLKRLYIVTKNKERYKTSFSRDFEKIQVDALISYA